MQKEFTALAQLGEDGGDNLKGSAQLGFGG